MLYLFWKLLKNFNKSLKFKIKSLKIDKALRSEYFWASDLNLTYSTKSDSEHGLPEIAYDILN